MHACMYIHINITLKRKEKEREVFPDKREKLLKSFKDLSHISHHENYENVCLVTIILLWRTQDMRKDQKVSCKYLLTTCSLIQNMILLCPVLSATLLARNLKNTCLLEWVPYFLRIVPNTNSLNHDLCLSSLHLSQVNLKFPRFKLHPKHDELVQLGVAIY